MDSFEKAPDDEGAKGGAGRKRSAGKAPADTTAAQASATARRKAATKPRETSYGNGNAAGAGAERTAAREAAVPDPDFNPAPARRMRSTQAASASRSASRPTGAQADPGRVDEQVDSGVASRRDRIAQAAYYLAERRGFDGERQVDDWLEAERAVDAEDTAGR